MCKFYKEMMMGLTNRRDGKGLQKKGRKEAEV
jgi:hypothetical protein